jgi:S1-C subfamily serine protease
MRVYWVATCLLVAVSAGAAWADTWEERVEASVAKVEAGVKALDGKEAAQRNLPKRLADLDARIGYLEEKAGRPRRSESILEEGARENLLSSWTQTAVSLGRRLAALKAPPPPPTAKAPNEPVAPASDDPREERFARDLSSLEDRVAKADGGQAVKGSPADRLRALDERIRALEKASGRAPRSEDIPESDDRTAVLRGWTAVLERLDERLALTRPTPGAQGGDGSAPPDPSTLAGSGTGFFITADGMFVTCAHVVDEGGTIRIATETGSYAATVVAKDDVSDLAILRVKGTFQPLPIAQSVDVRLGASVGTVGYPNPDLQGNSPKATRGEISSLAGLHDDRRNFQVSLPVQPGNSGGALFDARGNVIGVVAATLNVDAAKESSGTIAQNVNYAVKSAHLLDLVNTVPGLAGRLCPAFAEERKFEDAVGLAQAATAMVLRYDSKSRQAGLPAERRRLDPTNFTFQKDWLRQIPWPVSCDDWGQGYVVSRPTGEWHSFSKVVPGGATGWRTVTYRKFLQTGQDIFWYLDMKVSDPKAGVRKVHYRAAVACKHGVKEIEDDWVSSKADGFYSGARDSWVIGRESVAGPEKWWPDDTEPRTSAVASRYAFTVDYLICNKGETVLFGDSPAAAACRCLREPPKSLECLATHAYVTLATGNMERFAALVDWTKMTGGTKKELLDRWKARVASNKTLGKAISEFAAAGGPSVDGTRLRLPNCTLAAEKKPDGRWAIVSLE